MSVTAYQTTWHHAPKDGSSCNNYDKQLCQGTIALDL
jgi:hypothetical protein